MTKNTLIQKSLRRKALIPLIEEEESERKAEEFKWPVYDYSWQDFVPATFSAQFGQSCSEVPSLLSIVSDVSETVPNGALWFNFVFD